VSADNRAYVRRHLKYERDRLVDEEGNAIMMSWERGIMRATAAALCSPGARVLNIGFGMGLIDTELQRRRPSSHHIVEPHPDVHAKMVRDGWLEKAGVTVHHDFWQNVITRLPRFDCIYFDTWEDTVDQFRHLARRLPKLLRAGGRFSWFNEPEDPDMVRCVGRAGLEISRIRIPVSPPRKAAQGSLYYFESRTRRYDIVIARRVRDA
jgi:protein arginine N-methyltransferase 2